MLALGFVVFLLLGFTFEISMNSHYWHCPCVCPTVRQDPTVLSMMKVWLPLMWRCPVRKIVRYDIDILLLPIWCHWLQYINWGYFQTTLFTFNLRLCIILCQLFFFPPVLLQSDDDNLEKDKEDNILMVKEESWVADWSSRPENIPPKWVDNLNILALSPGICCTWIIFHIFIS